MVTNLGVVEARRRLGQLTRRPWALGLGAALASAVLFAACGGGDASETTASTDTKPPASEQVVEAEVTRSEAPERAADAVPDFEIALFGNENHTEGELVRLSELQGQPVVLNFWFPSCPPCRAEMPDFEASFRKHKDSGIHFIGVQQLGLDSAQDGRDFITDMGLSYAIGPDVDNSIFLDYEIRSFPTTYFLDRDHRLVRKWQGPLNEEKLEEFIGVLLQ